MVGGGGPTAAWKVLHPSTDGIHITCEAADGCRVTINEPHKVTEENIRSYGVLLKSRCDQQRKLIEGAPALKRGRPKEWTVLGPSADGIHVTCAAADGFTVSIVEPAQVTAENQRSYTQVLKTRCDQQRALLGGAQTPKRGRPGDGQPRDWHETCLPDGTHHYQHKRCVRVCALPCAATVHSLPACPTGSCVTAQG